MRTFTIGDLHGNYKALKQVLERSGFDYENDRLITLGDIVDGYPEVYECVEELLKIKNRIDIRGNHDFWFYEWIGTGAHPALWGQGGKGTFKSYFFNLGLKEEEILTPHLLPREHISFFARQLPYYIDDENRLYVHGGINRHYPITDDINNHDLFMWDRDFFMAAMSSAGRSEEDQKNHPFKIKGEYKKVFVGHTTTLMWGDNKPIKAGQVWNLDTGAGWQHKLTIMNVDTEEYWQSDLGSELYPNEQGR